MKIIFKCLTGSRLYGVNNQDSDFDYKGVYLLPLNERNKKKKSSAINRKLSNTESIELFHFEAFLNLIKEGQTVPFEMLFCPDEFKLESSPLWEKIIINRNKLIHKNITAFYGMALKQSLRYSEKGKRIQSLLAFKSFLDRHGYGLKLKEIENDVLHFIKESSFESYRGNKLISYLEKVTNIGNEKFIVVYDIKFGFNHRIEDMIKIINNKLAQYGDRSIASFRNDSTDYKSLSHCVRIYCEAKELLLDHKITLPLKEKDRDLVKEIKDGKMSREEIMRLINSFLLDLKSIENESTLSETCDEEFIDHLLSDYKIGKF